MGKQESTASLGVVETPGTKPRASLSAKGLLLALLAGIPITIGMFAILGTALSVFASTTQPGNPAIASSRRLEGIAVWRYPAGFRICTRPSLHDCRVRFGFTQGGDRGTLEFESMNIQSTPSCATQANDGFAACSHPSGLIDDNPSPERTARCLLTWGLLTRDESVMHTVDPRDPQLPPGIMRLECREGYYEGSFENTM